MGINVLRFRLNLRNGSNKRLSWLVPNFSHHWLNYALSLIVFFGMFSAVSAFATEPDYFWGASKIYRSTSTAVHAEYCDSIGYSTGQVISQYETTAYVQCDLDDLYKRTTMQRYQCSSAEPYFDTRLNKCVAEKYVPSCEPGQYKLVTYKTVSTYLGQGDSAQGIVIRPKPYKFGECVYTMTGIALNDDYPDPSNADSSVDCRRDNPESKDLICYHTTWMMTTGDSADPNDTENYNPLEDPEFVEDDKGEPVASTVTDEEETDIGDAITEMLDDGATVETQTTTTTETRGDGATVTTDQETTTVHRTDGIDKVVTTTTTTITRPDGSTTTVVETTTEYTQKPQQEYTITENEDGTVSVSATGSAGTSAGTTTTTTTDKDPDGNTTGTSTTTEQTGDKPTQEQQEAANFCKSNPGHPDCKSRATPGANGIYEPNQEATMDSVLTAFTDSVRNAPAMQAAQGFFDISASGSCEVWHVETWAFSITIDQHCSSEMVTILQLAGAVVLATAAFFAFRIAFL